MGKRASAGGAATRKSRRDKVDLDDIDKHYSERVTRRSAKAGLEDSDDSSSDGDDDGEDDEIDAFGEDESSGDEDSEDDDADASSDSDEYDSEDEQDNADLDMEEAKLLRQLEKQEKALRMKARASAAAGSDDDDDGSDDDGEDKGWGGRRGMYYGGDDALEEDGDDDGQALRDEEAEVRRLQQGELGGLEDGDFAQLDDDGGDGGEESDDLYEEDEQLAGERAARVADKAPELASLLEELRGSLSEAREKVGPLLEAVRDGVHATSEGLSYLEAKQMLLLSYCSNIAFYVLLRAEGKSVRTHPVMERLVRLRLYLEKARPIDRKLQYLVDKLLAAGVKRQEGGGDDDDAEDDAYLAPRPERMAGGRNGDVSGAPEQRLVGRRERQNAERGLGVEGDEDDTGGAYKPPRLRATSMHGEGLMEDDDGDEGAPRVGGKKGRRTGRNAELRDIVGHVGDGPEELREREDRGWALRERRRAERRAEAEEDMFVRKDLTKKERMSRAAGERQGNLTSGLSEFRDLGNIGDSIQDITDGMAADKAGKRRRLSEAVAKAGERARKVASSLRSGVSGDADVALNRPSLGERRSQMDRSKRPRGFEAIAGEKEDYGRAAPRPDMDDVGVYSAAAGKAKRRKAEKDELYDKSNMRAAAYRVTDAEHAEADTGGRREITKQMTKNVGLKPHRKKLARNPRAMAREKFRKATVRASGKGPGHNAEGQANYGGETTGIKGNLVRSRKFK